MNLFPIKLLNLDNFHILYKILKLDKNEQNYFVIKLIVNNKKTPFRVHRLVYDTFKKLSGDDKLVIDHIDRNSLNNHIDNLREVSRSDNSRNRLYKKRMTLELNNIHQIINLSKNGTQLLKLKLNLKYTTYKHVVMENEKQPMDLYGKIWTLLIKSKILKK